MIAVGPRGYELQRPLGAGSSASVFVGRDVQLARTVAVKRLATSGVAGLGLAPARREGRALARIRNPHVARVYDLVVDASGAWLVMDYAPGPTLQDLLREPQQLEDGLALVWAAQLADALAALSDAGVVHRDVKPANVVVSIRGLCTLVDFGLATAAGAQGEVVGTPAFMSPEQARGECLTPASDVYALGVLLFWLLAGRHPYAHAAGDPDAMMACQRDSHPDWSELRVAGVPDRTARLVRRAMRRRPGRRPTAAMIRDRLLIGLGERTAA